MKIAHVMDRTNWKMLAKQKLSLVELLFGERLAPPEQEHLQGILHWIDALQDAAEIDGFPVVFLTEDK